MARTLPRLPVCPGQGAGLLCSRQMLPCFPGAGCLSVRDSAPADSHPSLKQQSCVESKSNCSHSFSCHNLSLLSSSCLPSMQLARSLARTHSFLSSLPPAVSGRQVKVTVWRVCFCIIYVVEDRVRHLEDSLRSHVSPSKWDSIAQPAK